MFSPLMRLRAIWITVTQASATLVRKFLEQNPHVCFHSTPTYSSWLNQVELWFAKIEREVIARGVFTSVADLARKLRRYNAKPIQWKYSESLIHFTESAGRKAGQAICLDKGVMDLEPEQSGCGKPNACALCLYLVAMIRTRAWMPTQLIMTTLRQVASWFGPEFPMNPSLRRLGRTPRCARPPLRPANPAPAEPEYLPLRRATARIL